MPLHVWDCRWKPCCQMFAERSAHTLRLKVCTWICSNYNPVQQKSVILLPSKVEVQISNVSEFQMVGFQIPLTVWAQKLNSWNPNPFENQTFGSDYKLHLSVQNHSKSGLKHPVSKCSRFWRVGFRIHLSPSVSGQNIYQFLGVDGL